MRKSPLNHIITAVIALLAWVVSVVWVAGYLADDISFQNVLPMDFQATYRWIMTVLALAAIAQSSYWYHYGAKSSTATDLPRAKRIWVTIWFVQLLLSAASVVAVSVLFLDELFEGRHLAIMYSLSALQTWVTFWVATALFSPRHVQYVPWGKG